MILHTDAFSFIQISERYDHIIQKEQFWAGCNVIKSILRIWSDVIQNIGTSA